ncbi:MAG: hypothetical protein F7B17_05720 [Desulfurococcales archaeon]|nr:hypothetical protein [Desulfurococcales archaeon]
MGVVADIVNALGLQVPDVAIQAGDLLIGFIQYGALVAGVAMAGLGGVKMLQGAEDGAKWLVRGVLAVFLGYGGPLAAAWIVKTLAGG